MDKEFTWTKEAKRNLKPKPTLGKMLADTEDEHRKQNIEVGEFVEEVGNKEIMKEIWKQIEDRQTLPQWKDKYYILVYLKKSAVLHRVVECFVQCRHTQPFKEWGLTCFSYDPVKNILDLEWVLPNKTAVSMFMKNKDTTDPFLIKCIVEYLKEIGPEKSKRLLK